MIDSYLVPENTSVSAKGDGAVLDVSAAQNRVLLLQLKVTAVLEQQSLQVSVFGGPDESALEKAPLAIFPQSFYCEEQTLLLDLTELPEIKVLRAHWEVNRWGRWTEPPCFTFRLKVGEVSPELLREREAQPSK